MNLPLGDEAGRLLARAQLESRALGHGYVGTEHLLLAALVDRASVLSRQLEGFGLVYAVVRERVSNAVIAATLGAGDAQDAELRLTPRAKIVMELAAGEAAGLGDTAVAGKHIVMALTQIDAGDDVRDQSVAGEILRGLETPPDEIRDALAGDRQPVSRPRGDARPGARSRSFLEDLISAVNAAIAEARLDDDGRPVDLLDLVVALAELPGAQVQQLLSDQGLDAETLRDAADRLRARGDP